MGGRNFFVQSGRVAFINYGPLEGQSVVIVDIVDNSRVLVDGVSAKIARQTMPIRWLSLTKVRAPVARTAKPATVAKTLQRFEVAKQAAETTWAKKKVQQSIRAKLNDFDRFKVMLLKKQKAKIVNTVANKAIKEARKAGSIKA